MNIIKGVLCDLDGTLVESEELHLEAWNVIVRRAGHTPPSPNWNDDCIGLPDIYAAEKTVALFPDMGDPVRVNDMKQIIFRELVMERGLALAFPGVRDALLATRAMGIPMAVGTNSILLNTQASLEAAGLADIFTTIVSIDQVKNPKPAPDIYREAAKRLGIAPEHCVVLEDSTAGIDAGIAAGCTVLGLATTWPVEKLEKAHYIFDTTANALAWIRKRYSPSSEKTIA